MKGDFDQYDDTHDCYICKRQSYNAIYCTYEGCSGNPVTRAEPEALDEIERLKTEVAHTMKFYDIVIKLNRDLRKENETLSERFNETNKELDGMKLAYKLLATEFNEYKLGIMQLQGDKP